MSVLQLKTAGADGSMEKVQMLTAGSAPPGIRMREMGSDLGIRVLAAYGLTEV